MFFVSVKAFEFTTHLLPDIFSIRVKNGALSYLTYIFLGQEDQINLSHDEHVQPGCNPEMLDC